MGKTNEDTAGRGTRFAGTDCFGQNPATAALSRYSIDFWDRIARDDLESEDFWQAPVRNGYWGSGW
jgi:hypothetical protein